MAGANGVSPRPFPNEEDRKTIRGTVFQTNAIQTSLTLKILFGLPRASMAQGASGDGHRHRRYPRGRVHLQPAGRQSDPAGAVVADPHRKRSRRLPQTAAMTRAAAMRRYSRVTRTQSFRSAVMAELGNPTAPPRSCAMKSCELPGVWAAFVGLTRRHWRHNSSSFWKKLGLQPRAKSRRSPDEPPQALRRSDQVARP